MWGGDRRPQAQVADLTVRLSELSWVPSAIRQAAIQDFSLVT